MRSWLLVGGIVLVVAIALGRLSASKADPIAGDRLGPETGESTSDYAARAAATLDEGPDEPRWALISLDAPITVEQALATAEGARISQVLFRAPNPDGMLVFLSVPDNAEAVRRAPASPPRPTRRSPPTCACVAALLVRADPSTLRTLATHPGVSAVEALPADAVYGRFAIGAPRP